MNRLLAVFTIVFILALLCAAEAKAGDEDFGNRIKHGAVGLVIGGTITKLCKDNITLVSGESNHWGCFLMGVIPTIIGAAAFEAYQNDLTDAGGDILAGSAGAVIGSGLVIAIDF